MVHRLEQLGTALASRAFPLFLLRPFLFFCGSVLTVDRSIALTGVVVVLLKCDAARRVTPTHPHHAIRSPFARRGRDGVRLPGVIAIGGSEGPAATGTVSFLPVMPGTDRREVERERWGWNRETVRIENVARISTGFVLAKGGGKPLLVTAPRRAQTVHDPSGNAKAHETVQPESIKGRKVSPPYLVQ